MQGGAQLYRMSADAIMILERNNMTSILSKQPQIMTWFALYLVIWTMLFRMFKLYNVIEAGENIKADWSI